MDQERQELIDTIKLLTEAISEMAPSLTRTAKTINDFNKTIHGVDDAFDDFEDSIHEADTATKNEARQKREAAKDAKIAEQAREQAFDNSTKAAVNALTSFADTIFFSSEKGFSKFSGSLSSAGDAAFELGKSFGGLTGIIVGMLVKAVTSVVDLQLKQADVLLTHTDTISKTGAANSFTAEEVRQMGRNAGLASNEMDKLIKPMTSMGGGLRILGAGSAEAVESFAKMNDVSKETREAFQRLGLDDEQRIQATADYVNLLFKSNAGLTAQQRAGENLAKQAKAYTENLFVLAEMTGTDIENAKKQQEINRATYEWTLQQNKWTQERIELERKNDTEGLARLDAEIAAANKLIDDVGQLGDPAKTAAVQMQYLTGAVTSGSSQFLVLGMNIDEQIQQAKRGAYEQGQFLDEYNTRAQATLDNVGHMAVALSEDYQKASGLTMDTVGKVTDMQVDLADGMTQTAIARERQQAIDANEAGRGPVATDPAQVARNFMTETERTARLFADNLIAETNPLLQGLNGLTVATTALTAAVGVAVAALGAYTLKRGAGSILGGLGGGRSNGGGIPNIPESTGRAVSSLGTGLRGAGAGAANIALGGAAIGAAIAAIGAGIAGAAWLTGKAFPTFVEGLQSFEELNGSKLVDAAKGMTAIGAAIAAMGTGTFVGGILGGIGSLFIDDESGGTPIDKLKEFQEYDLDAPKITKNADAIIAYSNAMSALSDAPSGGVGLIEAAANGILGLFGVDQSMPWDKMVEFGNITLPTEKIKANSEAVTAYAIAMAKLTTVNGLESFGNMAAGIFDSIGNWARGSASLPWDDMMTFAGLSIPDTLESNVEKLNAFGEAISNLPEISIRREGGLIGTIANFFSGDVQMPWDALEDFSNVSFTEDQSANIIRNAELLGAFGEAVSKVPELPTSTTSGGKFDAIASYFSGDVQMPWDTLKAFSEVTFTEEAAEKIAENANILKIFGEALSSMPQEIKVMELDSGWFSDELLMPWDLLKTFSAETFEEAKIKENSEALKIFGEALSAIPEIEITFSEENKNNFDRLTESLDSFSKLRSDDIMKNLDALQRFQTTTSLVRAPESQVNVTPNSQIVSAISNTNENVSGPTNANINQTSVTTTSNSVDINEQLITMLSQKLDTVINILGDSVDIQDRSFRYNSV